MMKNYQSNKKIIITVIIAWVIIGGATIIYWFLNDQKLDKENLNIEFAGSVERIEYDIKQYPTITINNKSYYIGAGYHTEHQIEVGDSVIKKRGSDIYKLIKQRSNKIIEFIR